MKCNCGEKGEPFIKKKGITKELWRICPKCGSKWPVESSTDYIR
jgi:hypothetical protein